MDAYQNLISGDKRSLVTQGNCSEWLLPCYKYYTQNRPKNQDTQRISIIQEFQNLAMSKAATWFLVPVAASLMSIFKRNINAKITGYVTDA